MQIQFNTDEMSTQLCIDIANALSRDIDQLAEVDSLSLSQTEHDAAEERLKDQFDSVCDAIRRRGVDVTEFVRCPNY